VAVAADRDVHLVLQQQTQIARAQPVVMAHRDWFKSRRYLHE
jgi:hypothetical protein